MRSTRTRCCWPRCRGTCATTAGTSPSWCACSTPSLYGAGSRNASAQQLHVHVNPVRYRIRRIEELTGRNLATMADRVDFFLALRDAALAR
ncbi:helix-turn-helix domain-containing protein [Nonomuraea sp. NPDC049400]|uniref:helix-turn-helix domain-containing protein n=1 Tax=Nonomuraea sp. NPDC049400 TaxID=3364352 RepID=UPI0037B51843